MKHILEQLRKAENACNRANMECEKLARLVTPYINEDLRDCVSVFEQKGDGLVMVYEDKNYPISDIIESINKGAKDIDMRDRHCPIKAI